MAIGAEIRLTCLRELRRNLRSVKGLLTLGLFLLVGLSVALGFWQFSESARLYAGGNLSRRAELEAWQEMLTLYYRGDEGIVQYVVGAPPLLWVLHTTAIFLLPLIGILIGYDQLAGEMQHRTIRYTVIRARRTSLVLGKFFGMWLVAAALVFGLALLACALTIARGDAPIATTLTYGARFWAMEVVFAGAYVGLTTLLSACFRTPTLALLSAFGTLVVLGVVRIVAQAPRMPAWFASIRHALPGAWEPRLVSAHAGDVLGGTGVCLAFAAICVAGACALLERRDV
jgi:ABC-type transport system involved in multi-copper enzyme maturation permease subunit